MILILRNCKHRSTISYSASTLSLNWGQTSQKLTLISEGTSSQQKMSSRIQLYIRCHANTNGSQKAGTGWISAASQSSNAQGESRRKTTKRDQQTQRHTSPRAWDTDSGLTGQKPKFHLSLFLQGDELTWSATQKGMSETQVWPWFQSTILSYSYPTGSLVVARDKQGTRMDTDSTQSSGVTHLTCNTEHHVYQ